LYKAKCVFYVNELKTCVPTALKLWEPGRCHTCERTKGQREYGFSVISNGTSSDKEKSATE